VEVGGKVKDIRVGDRVAALGLGAMAHYVSIPKASLGATVFKLPEGLSYEEAATIEPLATSFHACSLAGTVMPAPWQVLRRRSTWWSSGPGSSGWA